MAGAIADDWFVALRYCDSGREKRISAADLTGAIDKSTVKQLDKQFQDIRPIEHGFVIGRGKDDVAPNRLLSAVVSKIHCAIGVAVSGVLYITDLGSAHGTTILPAPAGTGVTKPKPIILVPQAPVRLLEGDRITFGRRVVTGDQVHDPLTLTVRFRYPAFGRTKLAALPSRTKHLTPAQSSLSSRLISREKDRSDYGELLSHIRRAKEIAAGEELETDSDIEILSPRPPLPAVPGKYGIPESLLYLSDDEEPLPRSSSASPANGGSDSPVPVPKAEDPADIDWMAVKREISETMFVSFSLREYGAPAGQHAQYVSSRSASPAPASSVPAAGYEPQPSQTQYVPSRSSSPAPQMPENEDDAQPDAAAQPGTWYSYSSDSEEEQREGKSRVQRDLESPAPIPRSLPPPCWRMYDDGGNPLDVSGAADAHQNAEQEDLSEDEEPEAQPILRRSVNYRADNESPTYVHLAEGMPFRASRNPQPSVFRLRVASVESEAEEIVKDGAASELVSAHESGDEAGSSSDADAEGEEDDAGTEDEEEDDEGSEAPVDSEEEEEEDQDADAEGPVQPEFLWDEEIDLDAGMEDEVDELDDDGFGEEEAEYGTEAYAQAQGDEGEEEEEEEAKTDAEADPAGLAEEQYLDHHVEELFGLDEMAGYYEDMAAAAEVELWDETVQLDEPVQADGEAQDGEAEDEQQRQLTDDEHDGRYHVALVAEEADEEEEEVGVVSTIIQNQLDTSRTGNAVDQSSQTDTAFALGGPVPPPAARGFGFGARQVMAGSSFANPYEPALDAVLRAATEEENDAEASVVRRRSHKEGKEGKKERRRKGVAAAVLKHASDRAAKRASIKDRVHARRSFAAGPSTYAHFISEDTAPFSFRPTLTPLAAPPLPHAPSADLPTYGLPSTPPIPDIAQSHIASDSSDGPVTPKYRLRPLKRTYAQREEGQGEREREAVVMRFEGVTVDVALEAGERRVVKRLKAAGRALGLIALGAAIGSVGTVVGLMQMAE